MTTWTTETLGLVGLLGASGSFAMCVMFVAVLPQSPLRVVSGKYVRSLDTQFAILRVPANARAIFTGQLVAGLLVIALAVFALPLALFALPVVVFFPTVRTRILCSRRIERIEEQLDGWLLVLANALKAVPSLGDALASSQDLVHAPLSQELDIALKEYRLGAPLDVALDNMGERMNSRVVRSALAILRIARNTGGDLPSTLESAASSLREMARLQGVVRTKTADGRNQALVVGALPLIVVLALYFLHPDMLMPMFETFMGNVLLGIAGTLWVAAIALSFKILDVDI